MPPPTNDIPYALMEGAEKTDIRDFQYKNYITNLLLTKQEIDSEDWDDLVKQRIMNVVKNHINYPQNKHLDLTQQLPDVRDQGHFGSCAAHASASVREWQETVDYNLTKPISLSPQFIYDNRPTTDQNGWPMAATGMASRDVMKILQKNGIVEEIYWPYRGSEANLGTTPSELDVNQTEEPSRISFEVKKIAKKFCIGSYWKIRPYQPHYILHALATHGPVYIGLHLYHYGTRDSSAEHNRIWSPASNFEELLGEEDQHKSHAMTIVGFKDLNVNSQGEISGNFVIRNSWGDDWGDSVNSFNEPFGHLGKGYVEMPITELLPITQAWAVADIENTVSLAPEDEAEAFDYYYGALRHFSDSGSGSNPIPSNPNNEHVYLLGIRGWRDGRIAPKMDGKVHDSIVAMWIDSNQNKHCQEFTARTSPTKKETRGKKGSPRLAAGVHTYSFEPKNVSWANSDFTNPSVSVTGNSDKFRLVPAKTIEYFEQLPNGKKGDVKKKGTHVSFKNYSKSQPGDQAIYDYQFDDFISILVNNHVATVEVEKGKISSSFSASLKDSNYDLDDPPDSINIHANITYTLITNAELLDYLEAGE